jgi:radical SAM superfamily enzyme YgiQ (UPF0313 family)
MSEQKQKPKILLIQPYYELEIRWIVDEKELDIRADYLPLGPATIAALTPEDQFDVVIWDELVRGKYEESNPDTFYDIIGITSLRANIPRAKKIAEFCREQGSLVVIGGPGVSGTPDRCRGHFDILFIGECELIWPKFLTEWQQGKWEQEYRQIEKPDINLSPMPRWDSILPYLKHYAMGCVQTTRGCPFDCDFCDVIYLNGRRQRHKTNEQVLEEVRVLERMGMKTIMFNDDNLPVSRKWCKELLQELIDLNNQFELPLRYATQASIDMVRDKELLQLLADANFYQMLVGIETPSEAALEQCGKVQNLKRDLVADTHELLSYGMVVRGGLIVGFDTDGPEIFDQQFKFIQDSFFPSVSIHMLNAPMGTRLWRRLRAEGRVIDPLKITANVTQRIFNNVIPKGLTRVELMKGFRDLYLKVFAWPSFEERMINWIKIVDRPPNVRQAEESLDYLLSLGEKLDLEPEANESMKRIFLFTAEKMPFMLGRVKELVIQFVKYADDANSLIPKLNEQIELESSGVLKFEQDSRPLTIPDAFREDYRDIFSEVYPLVWANLEDKEKVPAAMVEVFMDFMVHELEGGLEKMEQQHMDLLFEMVDRVCAEYNGTPPVDFVRVGVEGLKIPSAVRTRLADDVINDVEQQLMLMQVSSTNPNPGPSVIVSDGMRQY